MIKTYFHRSPFALPLLAGLMLLAACGGNEPAQTLNLSTADPLKVGFHPWLQIGSARWLKIRSAPTAG
jgi:hypothetical protein